MGTFLSDCFPIKLFFTVVLSSLIRRWFSNKRQRQQIGMGRETEGSWQGQKEGNP